MTGAFGYSGRYIAARLLNEGRGVITLTNSLTRANPFGDQVRALPLSFDEPELLAKSLTGVEVLYNTYWVRFNHKLFTHEQAVRNTLALFEAARRPAFAALFTSASPTRARILRWNISRARRGWNARCRKAD